MGKMTKYREWAVWSLVALITAVFLKNLIINILLFKYLQ